MHLAMEYIRLFWIRTSNLPLFYAPPITPALPRQNPACAIPQSVRGSTCITPPGCPWLPGVLPELVGGSYRSVAARAGGRRGGRGNKRDNNNHFDFDRDVADLRERFLSLSPHYVHIGHENSTGFIWPAINFSGYLRCFQICSHIT
jgi:hypothetical protein